MESKKYDQRMSRRSQILSWTATVAPLLILALIVGLFSGFNWTYMLIAAAVGLVGLLIVRRRRNPFLLWQRFRIINSGIFVGLIKRNNRPSPETYQQKIRYRLPMRGKWSVWKGGITEETSRAWGLPAQRYAYTFYIKGEQGKTFTGDGTHLDDYYAMNQPMLAPANGTVIEVINDIRDYAVLGENDWLCGDSRGGYINIMHGEDEYSIFAHLVRGSITVKKGDTVRLGQLIGLCGNSGFSTEPHFHFHVQQNSSFYLGVGLPIQFYDIEIDGEPKDHAYISQDQGTLGNRGE